MKPYDLASLPNVVDLLLDAVCVVDAQSRFVFVSAACERIFGYTADEMIGKPMLDFVLPEDRARTLQAVDEIVANMPKPHFENRYVRKDGRVVHIMWSARWSAAHQVRVAVARDVTERKRAESMQAALYAISEATHAAADLPELYRQIHRIIGELLPAENFFVALYDADKDELSFPYYVDQHARAPQPRKLDEATLAADVIRRGLPLLLTADSAMPGRLDVGTGSIDWLGVPLNTRDGCIGALAVQSYSGELRYTERDVELLQYVSTQVAATIERKQMETWLRHIARHDQLTQLPNRELVHDRLQTALTRARRDRTCLALLYLDLDMFKPINDTFGHAIGDLLLREVALRLKQCVREADTVGRVGGDEFVVLLSHIQLPEHTALVADKILTMLSHPFELMGNRLSISPSIGIALYPEHGGDGQQLIRSADQAMYSAKKEGGNRFRIAVAKNAPAGDQ